MMRVILAAGPAVLALLSSLPAVAQEAAPPQPPLTVSGSYRLDLVGVAADGRAMRATGLDDLFVEADADLDRLAGWQGARLHVDVLNNLGGRPNDRAGTLQGIDNIEVAHPRLRLFQAWIEQSLGKATSLRAGLYDLNSEFYSNDAAALLIQPAFGVGSEIAATGTNGPSIFPITALALRIEHRVGAGGFVRAAAINATAGVIGDRHGSAFDFHHGALLIGEAGVERHGAKIALGAWGYTQRQDDIAATDAGGDPIRRAAHGAYLIAQTALNDPDGRFATSLFVRAGISDGHTTPFKGGWQAGLLATHIFPGRPDSQLSIGAQHAEIARGYRDALRSGGTQAADNEHAVELTYSDKPARFLTLQPDLQLVWNRGGDARADRVTVATLRVTLEY